MRRFRGTAAAIFYAYAMALVAVIFGISTLTTPRSDLMPYEQQGYKSEQDRCESKLRSFWDKRTPESERSENQKSQKYRDQVCLQIRSVEAAEWTAEYAARTYAWTIVSVFVIGVATIAAIAAAFFASDAVSEGRRAANAAGRTVAEAKKQTAAAQNAARVAKESLEVELRSYVEIHSVVPIFDQSESTPSEKYWGLVAPIATNRLRIRIGFINVGKVATTDIRAQVFCALAYKGNKSQLFSCERMETISHLTPATGATEPHYHSFNFDEALEQARSAHPGATPGDIHAAVVIKIGHRDVFTEDRIDKKPRTAETSFGGRLSWNELRRAAGVGGLT